VDSLEIDPELAGFAPAAAGTVLERSYGSPLEKAVLLVALLAAIDADASVALLSHDSRIATDVAWLGQFDEAWVVAQAGAEEIWLPTDRRLVLEREAIAGDAYVLRLARTGSPRRLEPRAPEACPVRMVAELSLSADGALRGDLSVGAAGAANPYFASRSAGSSPSGIVSDAASAFGAGATVDAPTVLAFGPNGTEVRGEISVRLGAEADGSVRVVPLPWPPASPFGEADLREVRQTPLALEGPGVRSSRIAVTVPAGWVASGLPSERSMRSEIGWLVQTVSARGDRLEVVRELGLRRRVVEPDAYQGLRELLAAADELGREVLVVTSAVAAQ